MAAAMVATMAAPLLRLALQVGALRQSLYSRAFCLDTSGGTTYDHP
jgi:hypothetical protein